MPDTHTDPFAPTMGHVRGSDRPDCPMAVLELIISTPVRDYMGTDGPQLVADVVAAMRDSAEALAHHTGVIERLTAEGWVLAVPGMADSDEAYQDLSFRLRQRFGSVEHAEAHARECGAVSTEIAGNWNLGWDERVVEDPAVDPVAGGWLDLCQE